MKTTTLNIRRILVEDAQRLNAGAARLGLTLPQFIGALARGDRWDKQRARLAPDFGSGVKVGYYAAADLCAFTGGPSHVNGLPGKTTTLNIRKIDVDAAQRLKAGAARLGLTLPQFLGGLARGSRWDESTARLYFQMTSRRHQSTR